jgi:predicted RNA-binding protein YlxR (DUF448 family)
VTRVTTPERTCVGCRSRRPQAELVRVVLRDGAVVPAETGAQGRGAYLCPDEKCLAAAQKRRAFGRAFRSAAAFDVQAQEAVTRIIDSRKAVR